MDRVKEIQGSAGAHIVLDPHLDDLSESLSCFDIRLPFSDIPVRGTGGFNAKIGRSTRDSCGQIFENGSFSTS